MSNKTKVAVIGAGNVGCTVAYTLINQAVTDEIVLIDLNHEKAYAESLDMAHSVYFMNRNVDVHAGDYTDTTDADVVIITAAAPVAQDAHNRLEMLAPSMRIMESIVSGLKENNFTGKIIVVSNPVDIMTYYVYKLSGLPANHVIGSGTSLDTARLNYEIAKKYNLKPSCVDSYILGEHGDSEIAAWSSATVGGKLVDHILEDSDEDIEEVHNKVLKDVIEAGWEIFNRKGNTCYGVAAAATAITKAILEDEGVILPVSSLVEGKYGIDGVYISVPCILDHDGVRDTIDARLEASELAALQKSASLLKSFYAELNK